MSKKGVLVYSLLMLSVFAIVALSIWGLFLAYDAYKWNQKYETVCTAEHTETKTRNKCGYSFGYGYGFVNGKYQYGYGYMYNCTSNGKEEYQYNVCDNYVTRERNN